MNVQHVATLVGEALRTEKGKARLGPWYHVTMCGVLAMALAGSILMSHFVAVSVAKSAQAENLTRWANKIESFMIAPGDFRPDPEGYAQRHGWFLYDANDPLHGADNATRAAQIAAVRQQADQAAGEANNAATWERRLHDLGFTYPGEYRSLR